MSFFKNVVEKLKELQPEHIAFDPATLDDPVALQTEWGPAKSGGTNFRTHQLARADHNRLEFHATWGVKLFATVFFLMGSAALVGGVTGSFEEGAFAFDSDMLIVGGIGLVFAMVGAGMYFFFTAPIVFDKRVGAFWKGRTAPDQTFNRLTLKHYAELKDIHALQLLAERVSGKNSSYLSYELNVVLHDGSRINVIDHGDLAAILRDAGKLSEFLECPIWDAGDFEAR